MSNNVKYQYVQMILNPGDLERVSDLLNIWSKIVNKKESAILCRFLASLNEAHITNVRSEEQLKNLIARNQNI
ncbi:MAG: hypothetical protein IJW99_10570 [Clostridia bacterium]|nr:hypothetical protein [Clostridia bacterium]